MNYGQITEFYFCIKHDPHKHPSFFNTDVSPFRTAPP